ncbi:MAG: radical SAM protein [Candidatus Zixiibacteriota bacterium]|nr:MAG: radical SAM protein [candidate division Zixibacteria bacterium]
MRENRTSPGFTFGIGLTDRCNAACPHCYSRSHNGYHDLDYAQVLSLVNRLPVESINFGTGESILYPRFTELVRELSDRSIDLAVTTNGLTVHQLPDADLRRFHDIDFSLDYPDAETNDRWRGQGSFDYVMEGVARCRDLGVEASLVGCLMRENAATMGKLAELACKLDLNLRVNVYKPVHSRDHRPTYEQFWQAIADMAGAAAFSACSEPVVNAAIGNPRANHGNPCGRHSFRVHADGKVVPCVYLNHSTTTLDDLLSSFETQRRKMVQSMELPVPAVCRDCSALEVCAGGCASRRLLGHPAEPDEYCFKVRGDHPVIPARWKESKGLVHENYLCTMIFSA